MTVDPEEMGFSLSIEVRENRGKNELVDITVNEIHCWNYDEEEDENKLKIFTNDELNTLVIYHKDTIEFGYRGESGETRKTYRFSSNKVTIKEFVDAIIDFEKITRPSNGGIDRHHIFFEGIEQMEKDGPYHIIWGS